MRFRSWIEDIGVWIGICGIGTASNSIDKIDEEKIETEGNQDWGKLWGKQRTCGELEVKISHDLTEMSIVAILSWNGRVKDGFRMIEEGTLDCVKADIELITPPSFEFEIIISFADL